ncbi:hypothetical protein ACEUZ9_000973 [Paracoccus litorisediminis]|uniref:hypothetical protein n=1 Tax=Paracoccus litorisediminis TaxID=2006130 RepID=UPI003731FAF7
MDMTDLSKVAQPAIPLPAGLPSGKVREAPPVCEPEARRPAGCGIRRLLMACAAIPFLFCTGYNLMATERYAAHASFVVRNTVNNGGSGDLLDGLTGSVSSGSTKSDSYIVRRFIESADLVRLMDAEFDLAKIYGAERADPISALRSDASFEDKVDYWNRRVLSSFDHTTGILTLEIQAYAPEEAKALADAVMSKIDDVVNAISADARNASYEFARKQADAAAVELRAAQSRVKDFRSARGIADPVMSASRDDMLIFELNKQIIEEKAALGAIEDGISRPGANVARITQRIAALEHQRDGIRQNIASGGSEAMVSAEAMNEYEALTLEVEIARSRYMLMLQGMETARSEAERQQRYLAIFETPYVAEDSAYPRRLINIMIAAIAALMGWGIASFVVQMIRDHRH